MYEYLCHNRRLKTMKGFLKSDHEERHWFVFFDTYLQWQIVINLSQSVLLTHFSPFLKWAVSLALDKTRKVTLWHTVVRCCVCCHGPEAELLWPPWRTVFPGCHESQGTAWPCWENTAACVEKGSKRLAHDALDLAGSMHACLCCALLRSPEFLWKHDIGTGWWENHCWVLLKAQEQWWEGGPALQRPEASG